MGPLAIVLAAAAAAGAFIAYEKKKKSVPGQVPGALPGVVSSLTKGKSYAVIAVITKDITSDPLWNNPQLAALTNEQKIQQIISVAFTQAGAKMLSVPVIRDATEASKAIAGDPSAWLFNIQWMNDADHVTQVIPWLSNSQFVMLPVA